MIVAALKGLTSLALIVVAALAGAAAWSRSQPGGPGTALGAALHPSRVALAALDQSCGAKTLCRPEQAKRLGAQVLAAKPAAVTPFLYAAVATAATAGVESPNVTRLAARALAREPRAHLPRAMAADAALRAGDLAGRLHQLERLLDLRQDITPIYEAVADIAYAPGGSALLEQRIGAGAAWRDVIVEILAKRDFDPIMLVRWSAPNPKLQRVIINRVVEKTSPEAGFLLWQETLSPAAAAAFSWPYDSSFKGLEGPLPFNWVLAENGAEREAGVGLSVYYSGRGASVLAEQLMVVGPGRYQLTSEAAGDISPNGGRLIWSLTCRTDGAPIGALELRKLKAEPAAQSVFVDIPEGCPVQRLALNGAPGEFASSARATIRSIVLSPAPPAALAAIPTPGR